MYHYLEIGVRGPWGDSDGWAEETGQKDKRMGGKESHTIKAIRELRLYHKMYGSRRGKGQWRGAGGGVPKRPKEVKKYQQQS